MTGVKAKMGKDPHFPRTGKATERSPGVRWLEECTEATAGYTSESQGEW